MNSREILFQATINSLSIRLQRKLKEKTSDFIAFSKGVPESFQKEWEDFQEEVLTEAERLTKQENEDEIEISNSYKQNDENTLQERIDSIRNKVKAISRKFEVKD